MKHTKLSLTNQIRKKFTIRILICLSCLVILLVSSGIYDVTKSYEILSKRLQTISQQLSEFVISQILIDNPEGIDIELKQLKETNNFDIKWDSKITVPRQGLHWKLPLLWQYQYPIKALDGKEYGSILISSDLLNDKDFIYDFIDRIALFLVSLVILTILLFPLAKKIPQELFVRPIIKLLQILKNKEDMPDLPDNVSIEIDEIMMGIKELIQQVREDTKDAAMLELATQVAHDIRAPLTSLDLLTEDLNLLPDNKRILIRNSISRIQEISHSLLHKRRSFESNNTTHDIFIMGLISDLVLSIRTIVPNINIKLNTAPESILMFTHGDSNKIKSILSNIINNAIEAMHPSGTISIYVTKLKDFAEIKVTDNGIGIDEALLPRLFHKGATFNKPNGNGLGLYFAKQYLTSINSTIDINSAKNIGTTVTITLPTTNPTCYVVEKLLLINDITIVIIDDDSSIHNMLDAKLKSINISSFNIHHFYNVHDFSHWYQNSKHATALLFLVDYELIGSKMNGIDIIKAHHIKGISILMTNRYDDTRILETCNEENIRFLPKQLIPYLPIRRIAAIPDLILIDDDEAIHSIWLLRANECGKNIECFENPEDFNFLLPYIKLSTPIYIDVNLNNKKSGIHYAKQFHDKGFENIYLSTGYSNIEIEKLTFIKGILDKKPPF